MSSLILYVVTSVRRRKIMTMEKRLATWYLSYLKSWYHRHNYLFYYICLWVVP